MAEPLYVLIPGRLDQLTGGYVYDRHMVLGLRACGRQVQVCELPGQFPLVDETACLAATETIAGLADQTQLVIDSLALPACVNALQAHAQRLRVVALIHHPLAAETGLCAGTRERLRQVEQVGLSLVRRVIVTSPHTAQALAAYAVPAEHIGIVLPGTTPAPLGHGSRAGPTRLLCVATLIPRKGHAILVEALATLTDLDWRLTCIGSLQRHPDTAQAVRAMIVRTRLAGRITLCGEQPQERVETAYQQTDLFVLPSYYEGYGMALSEALAHGLPIVSTTAGAIPHTVPASAGLLVAPGDVGALAQALRDVMTQPCLRARLRTGAQTARRRLPQWQHAVEQFQAELDRVDAVSTRMF